MHYTYRNINEAFNGLVKGVTSGAIFTTKQSTRNGNVIRIPGPVTITYQRPSERVLFNTVRDCNPFFHLYESLWMLAGRNDVAPLKFFVDTIDQFSDDGVTFNGAYGHRWRHSVVTKYLGDSLIEHQEVDQLDKLIEHLKLDPTSRRAVLQMWNVEDDLLKIVTHDTTTDKTSQYRTYALLSKDVCCNLSVVFEIDQLTAEPQLNMTVFNRSNDMVLGMFGANVVHFSFLQEYMASRLGMVVGQYHQVSANLHIYESNWKGSDYLKTNETMWSPDYRTYKLEECVPLISDVERFESELPAFVVNFNGHFDEPFLHDVAQPMCQAYESHKSMRDYRAAIELMENVKAADWKAAGLAWLHKRKLNYEIKKAGN